MALIWQLKTPESDHLRDTVRKYVYAMNSLYICCLIMSLTEQFGPYCRATKLYPVAMNFEAALFLINMCYHHYLHSNNYWLKWEETAGR